MKTTTSAADRPPRSRFQSRVAAPWLGVAGAVFAADFATKELVRQRMAEGDAVALAPFFNLVSARNSGAAFSMLADAGGWQRPFFVALALAVSIALAWMLGAARSRAEAWAFSLILGGALGNALDRAVHARVTDFLDFHLAGWHWPAFNVADIGICVGAALLVISSFRPERPATS